MFDEIESMKTSVGEKLIHLKALFAKNSCPIADFDCNSLYIQIVNLLYLLYEKGGVCF